jgi:uncharacterized protein (TIGR02145 family)
MKKIAIMLTLLCTAVFAQNTFTDPRDGKKYKTAKIGEQIWMAENLDYAGKKDDIGVCYDKKSANCKKYGALYTYDEAKKVCPSGWHLPSQKEWQILANLAGGYEVAGKKQKKKNGWANYTTSRGKVMECECLDEFGFAALPGGMGLGINGGFGNVGDSGFWWGYNNLPIGITVQSQEIDISQDDNSLWSGLVSGMLAISSGLLSVRCVKD